MYLVTADEMQTLDRETITDFGIPGQVLMENAGRGAVEMLLREFPDIRTQTVLVLAGRGNNGGDGFVIARYLMEKQISTTVVLLAREENVDGDARANLVLLKKLMDQAGTGTLLIVPDLETFQTLQQDILRHDIIVDGILGTGLKSEVRGFFREVITAVNHSGKPVFSIDIPSGLHSDTGKPCGASIKARATATFGFAKTGHILYPGSELTGTLDIIDIGIPDFIARRHNLSHHLMEPADIARLFRPRAPETHKGTYGHLLVVAGSPGKTGAAALASNAAVSCGTGLVTLAVPASLNPVMEPQVTEPMTVPLPEEEPGYLSDRALKAVKDVMEEKQCIALGPGIGTQPQTRAFVKALILDSHLPMVLDADGLNCIADDTDILKKKRCSMILTPHPGEMARLCGVTTAAIQSDRIAHARSFARTFNVILVLKGSKSLVALPDGTIRICPTGNPGMAAGGMGDVLTGFIAGFAAQGFQPEDAAAAGVYLHGRCGDFLAGTAGPVGFTASAMIPVMPRIIRDILQ